MVSRPDPDDAAIRGYLLGQLPEADADALEEAYFGRPDILERIRGVEDDLLDDYVAGRLEPAEVHALESRYLASAPLRERVAAARALHRATAARRGTAVRTGPRPARWQLPLALAASVAPGPVGGVDPLRRMPRITPAGGSRPRLLLHRHAGFGSSHAPSPPRREARRPRIRAVFALSPVLLRAEGRPAPLRIPAGADAVVLELEGDPALLSSSDRALEAVIRTVEGQETWRGEARVARDARRPSLLASTEVPASTLVAGRLPGHAVRSRRRRRNAAQVLLPRRPMMVLAALGAIACCAILEPGVTVARDLGPGETATFQVALAAGDFPRGRRRATGRGRVHHGRRSRTARPSSKWTMRSIRCGSSACSGSRAPPACIP